MSITPSVHSRLQSVAIFPGKPCARQVYCGLLEAPGASRNLSAARTFLHEQLACAADLPCHMPSQPEALEKWIETETEKVGAQYADYLAERKAGGPRRYFSCRSHAMFFLQRIAPTKLVDGAWLYGTLKHWKDRRFRPLVRTYLEELGDGDPQQNHVVLYQRLLDEHGCQPNDDLTDDYYIQGALQLALGYHAEGYMPEVIGYNLGYEQLPLHLLITAFELNELTLDPYYFTLHVTVDNASTGHARKAVQAVLDTMPAAGDRSAYLQRVANGFRLNDLGLNSTAIAAGFNLQDQLVAMLERKRVFGAQMHSNFCRIGGRTVSEWLAQPGQIPGFLRALEDRGWIQRHQDPRQSRFWQLITGRDADMFGVFNPYETQLLYDWIAGDWLACGASGVGTPDGTELPRAKPFRRYRNFAASEQHTTEPSVEQQPLPAIPGDIDYDLTHLGRELRLLDDELCMQRLIQLMSPAKHPTAAGLLATRLFSSRLC